MLFWLSYALLWALVVLQAVFILVLTKEYYGSRGKEGVAGLTSGSRAPSLRGVDVDGKREMDIEFTNDKPCLVLFVSVFCEPCWRVRDVVGKVANDRGSDVELIVSLAGDGRRDGEFVDGLHAEAIVVGDPDGKNAVGWKVDRQPAVVAVDCEGIVRGGTLYATEEELNELVDRVSMSAPEVR